MNPDLASRPGKTECRQVNGYGQLLYDGFTPASLFHRHKTVSWQGFIYMLSSTQASFYLWAAMTKKNIRIEMTPLITQESHPDHQQTNLSLIPTQQQLQFNNEPLVLPSQKHIVIVHFTGSICSPRSPSL